MSYLEANTVNVHAVALDELDDTLGPEGLVAVVLKVVVVVVQLRLRASLFGELESEGKESLADSVVEGRRAVGTVLVECLVDDVPACADVLVPPSQLEDVVLHDGNKRLIVEVSITNPFWKLTVPDEVVAVDFLLVLLGPIAVAVGIVEGEVVAAGLNHLPLHSVLGCETRFTVSVSDDFQWKAKLLTS